MRSVLATVVTVVMLVAASSWTYAGDNPPARIVVDTGRLPSAHHAPRQKAYPRTVEPTPTTTAHGKVVAAQRRAKQRSASIRAKANRAGSTRVVHKTAPRSRVVRSAPAGSRRTYHATGGTQAARSAAHRGYRDGAHGRIVYRSGSRYGHHRYHQPRYRRHHDYPRTTTIIIRESSVRRHHPHDRDWPYWTRCERPWRRSSGYHSHGRIYFRDGNWGVHLGW